MFDRWLYPEVAGSTPAHFLTGCELSRLPKPRVGDIVLVHEPGTTWSKWLIGRITDIHPGEDGAIRSATVKTKQGTVTRSARSLRLVEPSSGQKISDLSCICHNSGDPLLKKRQSEMWLTARLFRPGKAAQYKRLRKHPGCLITFRRFRPPDAEGPVRSRCSSTICQTFDRRANERELYDIDSSWPTECGQSRRRGTHSVDSSEQRVNIYNRTKQQHEKSMITRTTSSRPVAPASGLLEPPMSGSLTAAVMLSAPLISRWSFGVLVHLVASSAAAGGLSDPGSGSPGAEITIWPAVRGYCSSSVRDSWAPSARVGSSRRGR
ncbi:hypothetical protein T09_1107 [Trichinella sp. T9]|nr:hypothetical protein T09_1107 [Trichinella sp. T9]